MKKQNKNKYHRGNPGQKSSSSKNAPRVRLPQEQGLRPINHMTPRRYRDLLTKTGTARVAAAPAAAVMAGRSGAFMAPSLSPIARALVMSTQQVVNEIGSLQAVLTTFVCDPSGTASNAIGVDGWSTRFSGFQQYRVRSTTWEITPLRTNVGTTTSSQASGFVRVWIEDTPQIGAPTTSEMVQANSLPVLCNTDRIERVHYGTNEPQDLNLTDINLAPSHVIGTVVQAGQHCLQIYGDSVLTGLSNVSTDTPLFGVRAYYDVEFFGIGGV